MAGDSVRGQLDSRGRPRRWLVADWEHVAERVGFELPTGDWGARGGYRIVWELAQLALAELPEGDSLRVDVQAQMDLPF